MKDSMQKRLDIKQTRKLIRESGVRLYDTVTIHDFGIGRMCSKPMLVLRIYDRSK